MNMRQFINILMLAEMSSFEAKRVLKSFGIDSDKLNDNELKSAYRKAAIDIHPDRGGDAERMKMLNAAYDVLKDDGKPSVSASREDIRPDFRDIRYVKKYFTDLSAGKPDVKQWTVWNFDGSFQRGVFTIPLSPEDFPKAAEIMQKWDRFYDCKAVLISRGRDVYVIAIDGESVKPVKLPEHDSHNENWSNDRSFVDRLPAELEQIKSGKKRLS